MRWLVALGGALGALGRVAVGELLGAGSLPAATLLVNLTGVLALGWLIAATSDERLRAAIGTGFLGAWTTFSALAVELDAGLAGTREPLVALGYAGITIAGGLAALRLGLRLGRPRPAGAS